MVEVLLFVCPSVVAALPAAPRLPRIPDCAMAWVMRPSEALGTLTICGRPLRKISRLAVAACPVLPAAVRRLSRSENAVTP